MSHPMHTAQDLARQIAADPVAARQIKEHLSEARLVELLEIQTPEDVVLWAQIDELENAVSKIGAILRTLEKYRP